MQGNCLGENHFRPWGFQPGHLVGAATLPRSEGSMAQQVLGDDSGLSDGVIVSSSEGYMDQQDTSEGDDSNGCAAGLNDDGALNYP